MLVAAVVFLVPCAAALAMTLIDPSFAYRVLPEEMLEELATSYAQGFEGGRESPADSVMAGFYVYNNVSGNPGGLPTGRNSFNQKFLNISPASGTVQIDKIVWQWRNDELAGYQTREGVFYRGKSSRECCRCE